MVCVCECQQSSNIICDAQVWVNYQIMATVSWNVQIVFPAPFRTLERLFSLLDLSLLRIMPVACIVPNYDFISDFYARLRRSVRVLVGLGISH